MKKLFLKSLALVMMLMMSVSTWAATWSGWIGDAFGGTYNNKYQMETVAGPSIVNIQRPGWAEADGMYITFPDAAFGEVRIAGVKAAYKQEGAGMCLYLSNFTTDEITTVDVMNMDNASARWSFKVWYSETGAEPTADEPGGDPEPEPTEINWSTISWVPASGDKFKVGAANAANMPQEVISVQQPGFATKPGIYMTFPGAVSDCSHNCGIQGGGICLYTDQFVAKETEVTVNYAGGSKTFVVYYADGLEDLDAEIPSEYCRAAFSSGNTACRISWETLDNGNVQISLFEPDGTVDAAKTHFRGNGVNIARLTVGGEDASTYFNSNVTAASNVQTLTLKDPAVKPAKGAKFAYPNSTVEYAVVKDGNAWPSLAFNYTYGGICDALDAPANVAVADNGTITFDAVTGAETYEAHVFDGGNEVYVGTVTNGGVIDYQVYVAKTLTVKVVAKSSAKADSDFSDAATWNAAASPLPASIWCEKAGVVTAANECCHAAFSINTLADGSVTIVIGATEGTPEGAKFRGANGMNGTFTLNGSAADFTACFDKALSADKTTVTLSLKGAAPAPGSIIDYSGQIECASSLHGNDWSNYDIKGYVYGTKCPAGVAVTGVALNKTTATIYVGDAALALSPVFTPSNAGNKNVTWATSAAGVATVANGQVTAVAPGEAIITVTTEDGGFQATCVVTVRAAVEAPTAPTWDAEVVKAVYSATYGADCGFGEWGSGTQYTQKAAGKFYTPGNYFGLLCEGADAKNCAAMDHYHMDVYPLQDMTITVVPIWGGAEQGVATAMLTAGQWNSVDIELSQWTGITNWTNIYQVKLDGLGGKAFYLNNVYFYRAAAQTDTEAPVMTSASLVSTSFLNAVLAVEATDNEAVTQYLVKNGEAEVGKFAPAAGKITVTGLAMGTAYTLSVYALDAADNVSVAGIDVNLTTVAGPAPVAAPTYDAADVIALYSDAYTTVNYNVGGWGQSTHEENMEIAAGEHALLMTTSNYQGWEFATQDLSGMTHVHFDVYVSEAATIQFTPIWGGEAVKTFNLVAGWNSIEAPLTLTWPAINLANVYQVKFATMPATCWIDNVFFVHKIVAVESISLDKTELDLAPEASETLVATVLPVDATNKNFTWATDAAGVATVVDGVVTAVAEGTANITATTEDGEKVATCVVTVSVVHPTGVSLDKTEITLAVEETETLVATVLPADAANKNVTWATNAPEVATVENGVVTAVANGEAVITVTTEDGSLTATCNVTVGGNPDAVTLTNGAHKIQYTAYKYACGVYELTITSKEALAGLGGSFWNVNGVGTDMRNSMTQVNANTLRFTVESSADPNIYTPLYMLMPGEVNFGSVTIDWIAKNPVATASSGNAALAIDGNADTRWESATNDAEWWMVDFGHKHEFNRVKITWETACSKVFDIKGSNDGENFTTIYSETAGTAGEHIYELADVVEYRYVKVDCYERATGYGNSFFEFDVYTALTSVLSSIDFTAASVAKVGETVALTATPKDQYGVAMEAEVTYEVTPAAAGHVDGGVYYADAMGAAIVKATAGEFSKTVDIFNYAGDNVALNKTVIAEGFNEAARVNDGNDGTEFQADPNNGGAGQDITCGFTIDLGAAYDLNMISIKFEGACSADYTIETSMNDVDYATASTVHVGDGINGHIDYLYGANLANVEEVRYLKFTSNRNATGWGMKVFEFRAFGAEHVYTGVAVESVALDQTVASLEVGEQIVLTATVLPAIAENKAVTWETSDADVATVADGVVTAVAEGEATITVRTVVGDFTATCVVTVVAPRAKTWYGTVDNSGVTFAYELTYNVDKTVTCVVAIMTEATGLATPSFSIDGEWKDLAKDGEVWTRTSQKTFTEGQEVNCFFYQPYTGAAARADFKYIVGAENTKPTVAVAEVKLDKESVVLALEETITLTATVKPDNATDKTITWETDNAEVATVENGVVTAIAEGTAHITATAGDKVATCIITVVGELEPTTAWGKGFDTEKGIYVAYSITRNADRTLTYVAEFVSQKPINHEVNDGSYHTMTLRADGKYEYTSTNTYEDGDVANGFFWLAYAGGVCQINFNYTVGVEIAQESVYEAVRENLVGERMYTFCPAQDVHFMRGVEFYQPETFDGIYVNLMKVDELKAGHGYIMIPTEVDPTIVYFGDVATEAVEASAETRGMQGHLGDDPSETMSGHDYVFVKNNHLQYANNNYVTNGKAYLCMNIVKELSAEPENPAPRRRIGFAGNTATLLDEANGANAAEKMLINGQVMILRGGKFFDATGRLVK